MTDLDLFGDPVRAPLSKPIARGYAYMPGTGPAGETCRTCRHCTPPGYRYPKCNHPRAPKRTRGLATDIRVRSPACRHWEAKP